MSAWSWLVDAVSSVPSYTGRAARQGNSTALAGATPTRPFGGINGVRPGTGSPISVSSLTVTITPFAGVFDLETSTLAGPTPFSFDSNQTVTLTAFPSSPNTRIDLISVRQDDHTEDGATTSQPVIVYTAGTAADPGTQPATPSRCMLLATVSIPSTGGTAAVTWVAPNTVGAGGTLPISAMSAAPATPYEGQVVYDQTTNTERSYNGSAWIVTGVNPAERLQEVEIIPTGTASTPTSSFTTWAAVGGLVVPSWATKAMVQFMFNNMTTPSTSLNVSLQLKIGSAAGRVFRIPGSQSNVTDLCWGYADPITSGLTAGSQSLNMITTWVGGTGNFQMTTASLITFVVEFMP